MSKFCPIADAVTNCTDNCKNCLEEEEITMTTEERLKREYEQKLSDLKRKQSACNHEWGEVKYDPEIKPIPKFEDRWVGVDYMPVIAGYGEQKINRWSRTCKKCEKTEYTYKQKATTQYAPDFN